MFFTHMHQMMTEGVDMTLVIRKNAGQLTVSLLPKSNSLKDDAQNRLVPLTMSGTPGELDAGFFPAAMQPLQRVAGLLSNMAQFEQQADRAAANSKAAKEKKEKETKEEKDKREKYEKYLKKAEELLAAKNYAEALTSLQQARLHATEEQAKKVDERIIATKAAMNQGSLFDMSPAQPVPAAPAAAAPVAPAATGAMPPNSVVQDRPASVTPIPPVQGYPAQPAAQPVEAIPAQPAPYPATSQYAAQPAAAPYPTGGYAQTPQPVSAQYAPPMPVIEPVGVPSYDNPDLLPTYRPEEYAGYVDFPQNMIAPAPNGTYPNINPQTF